MTFKPKPVRPTNEELLDTVGRMAAEKGQLPTAQDHADGGHRARPARRAAAPTVLVNFKATIPFAKLVSEVSTKEGGVRRMVARLMKEAGYDVPEQDLSPPVNRRIYESTR